MAKDKESWIDGYRKGLQHRVESACFESVNVTMMARMAERIESLESELSRYKNDVDNCEGGSLCAYNLAISGE